jgi:hypothetical protein
MKQRTLLTVVLALSLTLLACGMCTSPQLVCKSNQLIRPLQKYPGADAEITSLKPAYRWEYPSPDCVPEGYRLVVSDKADLSDSEMDLREANPIMTWTPDVELKDCTEYYWKVAAIAGDQDGPFSEVASFRTDNDGTCSPPQCTQADSAEPILTAPEPGSITSTTPGLSWQFTPVCNPDSFVIQLTTWFDFSDTSLILEGTSTGMQWSPSSPLANATLYYWRVATNIGDTVGPFSDVQWFLTGPECTDETELVTPELIVPESGATFSQDQVYLQWRPGEPGCIPDGYFRELQTVPDFSGLNLLLGIYNKPTTTTLTPGLNDCTRYFWRIAAIQNGVRGPESLSRSFSIEISDDCIVQLPIGQVVQNVNCRKGPHPDFEVMHILMQGELVELSGRNQAMTWLVVQLPNQSNPCWSAMDFIEPSIDPQDLPVMLEPSLPEPEVVVCHEDLSEVQCLSAGGEWKYTVGSFGGLNYYCECP